MTGPLDALVLTHAGDRPAGITSVCSAHPLVHRGCPAQGLADGSPVLIEATSNQVDQFGGYTGLRPADFRALVEEIADRVGFPAEDLVLGGDHLGPHRWRRPGRRDGDVPRRGTGPRVRRRRLHQAPPRLQLSVRRRRGAARGRGDGGPCGPDARGGRGGGRPRGPDGCAALRHRDRGARPGWRRPRDRRASSRRPRRLPARRSSSTERRSQRAGTSSVWPQVMALVVQPGVEFDHLRVVDYRPEATRELRRVLDDEPAMVFEAHSTDYQTLDGTDHSGRPTAGACSRSAPVSPSPCARRSSRWPRSRPSCCRPASARGCPRSWRRACSPSRTQWQRYYTGTAAGAGDGPALQLQRPDALLLAGPGDRGGGATLLENLTNRGIPDPLLSAFLPDQYDRVRSAALAGTPRELVVDRVRDVLRTYATAVTPPLARRSGPCPWSSSG